MEVIGFKAFAFTARMGQQCQPAQSRLGLGKRKVEKKRKRKVRRETKI